MQSRPSNSQYNPNENEHSCVRSLNARLKQYEYAIEILENQLVEQDKAKSEVVNLQDQLNNLHCSNNEELTRNQNQKKVYEDLEAVTIKNDQTLDCVKKLQQENQDIKGRILLKKAKKQKSIVKIEKLEMTKTEIIKHIDGLQKKTKNGLTSLAILKLHNTDMKEVMECKIDEEQRVSQKFNNAMMVNDSLNENLLELQRKSNTIDQTINDLNAKFQRRKEELLGHLESQQEMMTKTNQETDAVTLKLAKIVPILADWKVKREQLETDYLQRKATRDEERGIMRDKFKVLYAERDKLDDQLADISYEKKIVVSDNQRLLIALKNEANRLDSLTSQMERIEQRKNHERLIQSMQSLKCRSEITNLEHKNTVKDNKLLLVEYEVEQLMRLNYCRH